MGAENVLALGSALALSAVSWWAVDRRLRRSRKGAARGGLRVLAVVGAVVLALLVLPRSVDRTDSGTWICAVCGEMEERGAYLGLTVSHGEPRASRRSIETARSYSAWFRDAVHLPHSHVWIRTGCHFQGARIACSPTVEMHVYFSFLPLVLDGRTAIALVERIAATSESEAFTLLNAMNRSRDQSPFAELMAGAVSALDFGTAFDDWLASHPEWRTDGG